MLHNFVQCSCKHVEQFVLDEQLDVLFITETWLSCQGDEAKYVDMTPPGLWHVIVPSFNERWGVGFHCERHRL